MDYAQTQRNPAKHLAGLAFVIVLHVLLIYALVTGLARKAVDVLKQPLETKIIEEVKPPPPPDRPPPPPPKLIVPPPPFIPPPEIQIAQAPTQAAIAVVAPTPPAPPPPAPVAARPVEAPPHEPVRVAAVIDAKRSCSQPEYPSASRRLEETGTVILKFLIDLDGKVVQSDVESSSGHQRLDEAARDALSRCRFKPGSVDGKPEQSWARLKYTWKLN